MFPWTLNWIVCLSGIARSTHDGSLASGEAKPATSCGEGVQLYGISKQTRPADKVSHIEGFVLKVNWQWFPRSSNSCSSFNLKRATLVLDWTHFGKTDVTLWR